MANIPTTANGNGTAALVKAIRIRLDLSQEGFARLIDVSLRTVSRWELGQEPDPRRKDVLIRLKRVLDELPQTEEPRAVMRWLSQAQEYLDHCAPADLIRSDYGAKALFRHIQEQRDHLCAAAAAL